MNSLYKCLDEGGVGIFESPTGTGKSLSLICGALTWLSDQHKKHDELVAAPAGEAGAAKDDDDEPLWVVEQTRAAELARDKGGAAAISEARAKREHRLVKYDAAKRSGALVGTGRGGFQSATRRPTPTTPMTAVSASASNPSAAQTTGAFDLAEWEVGGGDGPSSAAPALYEGSSDDSSDSERGDGAGAPKPWRIFYCSRTHSQLAQVVGEVRKTRFGESLSVVSLAGRKQLCMNESVRSLSSSEKVNDACLDLQGKKKKKNGEEEVDGARSKAGGGGGSGGGGCPFNQTLHEGQRRARQAIADRLLNTPLDVEDLAAEGRKEGCCAYYATRGALSDAHLVLLPYASLLHAGTRAALGVSLERSVVIVDEAHNLLDTINDTHSVTLTARQLSEVSAQLAQYTERYHNRLKPANRLFVQQLLHVVRALRASMLPKGGDSGGVVGGGGGEAPTERIVRMNAFLCSLNIDHLNLFRLQAFCEGSQIANKLRGFADSQAQREVGAGGDAGGGMARGSLHGVIRVLDALTNVDADARVLLHLERPSGAAADASWLRVLHLNPAVHFDAVLDAAHSVVLAGGTMQPIADLEQQVFRGLPAGRLRTCSFGHIVPPANLLPLALATGPTGKALQFTFASRAAPELIDELGRVLLRVCAIVPDGVVVFVPSFGYEEQLVARLIASGVWGKLAQLKKLFREPREASELDRVLRAYSTAIEESCALASPAAAAAAAAERGGGAAARGALLLSVVGGKMSEGINFADGLGRCVVMVGMPFANPSEVTLQERMAHLDATQGAGAGREYYTNLCMKAVNQSVGRAIRHIGDYAMILMVDGRFAKPAVRRRLPKWISDHVRAPESFDEAMRAVHSFFMSRKPDQIAIEQRRHQRMHQTADVVN